MCIFSSYLFLLFELHTMKPNRAFYVANFLLTFYHSEVKKVDVHPQVKSTQNMGRYRGSPTYTKITNTVSTNTFFGLCMCKWGN